MSEIDYQFARTYHQSLLHAAEAARQASAGGAAGPVPARPYLRDRMYLWLGNKLVATGERLRAQSAIPCLTEECA